MDRGLRPEHADLDDPAPPDRPNPLCTKIEAFAARTLPRARSARGSTPSASPPASGQKEVRYAHLLAGDVVYDVDDAVGAPPPVSPDRLAALEEHVQELRTEVADLRAQLATFRRQFD